MVDNIFHERQKIKKEAYIKIYEQFSRQLQYAVDANQKQVFLQVPGFMIGCVSYDTSQAAVYLKRQFTRAGFDVTDVTDSSFVVSWFSQGAKKVQERVSEPLEQYVPDTEGLPSLINLKKAANRFRK